MADTHPHIAFAKRWSVSHDTMYQLGQCDAIIRAIRSMPLEPGLHQYLLNVSLTRGAQATTAIEGNTLTDDEIQQIAKGKSLPQSKEYLEREVKNILRAMNALLADVVQDESDQIITEELLLRFHKMVGEGLSRGHFDAIPGKWRTDQRVAGTYRCPDHAQVVPLIKQLCEFLRTQFHYARGEHDFIDAVVEAIVAHVYIEWIHPFGDGNGRTGRLVEFYIMLRAGNPDIASHILSNHYNETRTDYYNQLIHATKTRDLTQFIAYAVRGLRDGLLATLDQTQGGVFETAWRSYVFERFDAEGQTQVLKRRRALVLDIGPAAGITPKGVPDISPTLARLYGEKSRKTIKRDLEALRSMDLVVMRDGEYHLNMGLLQQQLPRRVQR